MANGCRDDSDVVVVVATIADRKVRGCCNRIFPQLDNTTTTAKDDDSRHGLAALGFGRSTLVL
jgi:hypothetical protein